MNPSKALGNNDGSRFRALKVQVEDAIGADEIFTALMERTYDAFIRMNAWRRAISTLDASERVKTQEAVRPLRIPAQN